MTYCQSITQILRIIWVRCIPLNLWSKHDREQHLCFLLGFTPVDRKGRSAAHFPLRQTWPFQLPYHKLSVPEHQHSIFARLWRFYLTAHTVCQGSLFLWMFYSKGGGARLSSKLLGQGYAFKIVPQEVLWSIWGSPKTLWSPPLQNATWHSGTWPSTVTPSAKQTLHQFVNLLPNWTFLSILTLLPNFERFP